MKTSKFILIGSAVLLTSLLVLFMLVLKSEFLNLQHQAQLKEPYEAIRTTHFDSLNIQIPSIVKIRQGTDFKVEVNKTSLQSLTVVNLNGTLSIHPSKTEGNDTVKIKISAPSLKGLKASGKVKVSFEGFDKDTVWVELQDGVVFTGKNNKFNSLNVRTRGEVSMSFTGREFE